MYAITGATGNTGKVIAETLLAKGEKVRVISRSAERLHSLVQKGAEAFVGDVADANAMTRAFTGARAIYAIIPPSMTESSFGAYQDRISDALATAIQKAGVTHVVSLSSVGADRSEKVGPVTGLHRFEQKLNRISGANVLHLRPVYFFENLLGYIGLIKSMGMIAGTLKGDLLFPMIATRDIAAFAADRLQRCDFTGQTSRDLRGQRDLSMNEVAKIIGKAIGKEHLSYSQVPAMMVKPALTQMGISPDVAGLLLEMYDAINSSWMKPTEARSARNTTPTSIETFVAEEFVPRFQGKPATA